MYINPISINNVYNKNINSKGYVFDLKMSERIPVSLNPVKNTTNKILKKITILSEKYQNQVDPEIKRYIAPVILSPSDKNKTINAWDINKNNSKRYLIVMHGLSHNITSLQDLYKGIINNTDYAILAPEYTDVCYPHANRKTFSDKTIIDDSKASIDYLDKKGIKREDICVVGHSFGGYIASMMAKEFPDIGRLILISSTDSFKHRIYCIEQGTNPFISKRAQYFVTHFDIAKRQLARIYETNKVLKEVTCPVDIIHAKNDNLVEQKTAEYLASVCPNLSSFHVLQEGSHRMDNTKIEALASILNNK